MSLEPTINIVKSLPCVQCGVEGMLNFAVYPQQDAENRNVFVTAERCRRCSGAPTHDCASCKRPMNRTREVLVRGVKYRLCRKCRTALHDVLLDERLLVEFEGLLHRVGGPNWPNDQENRTATARVRWVVDVVRASTPEERHYIAEGTR